MDYQQGGWFRPTCAGRSPQPTACKPSPPTPRETPEGYAPITPTSLAMAYAPIQEWRMLYEPCKALSRGTLFAELDKPFTGKCC